MKLNPPYRIRITIYVITVIGTAVLVPLHQSGLLPDVVLAVWTSLAGAVSGLAAINVTPEDSEK